MDCDSRTPGADFPGLDIIHEAPGWRAALPGLERLARRAAAAALADKLKKRAAAPEADGDEVELEDVDAEAVEDADDLEDEDDAIDADIEVEGERDEEG